jgi:hypothetical protein
MTRRQQDLEHGLLTSDTLTHWQSSRMKFFASSVVSESILADMKVPAFGESFRLYFGKRRRKTRLSKVKPEYLGLN